MRPRSRRRGGQVAGGAGLYGSCSSHRWTPDGTREPALAALTFRGRKEPGTQTTPAPGPGLIVLVLETPVGRAWAVHRGDPSC